MSMPIILRDQQEILKRYLQAIQSRTEAEAFEYLRQLHNATGEGIVPAVLMHEGEDGVEDYKDINRTARQYLGVLLRRVNRGRGYLSLVEQYVAWKWLLGHPDADSFPGANGIPPGTDPRLTYTYLRQQIEGGEWDRLTQRAKEGMKGRLTSL